ncbi:MAG: hypothetical protein SFY95_09340 [Planctomycetota bacterium]|nr:hypothetical protein [Planctomycetota bacterium]
MSAKWHRVKRWDDEHLVGALTPVRWVLRAFSSISMAVVLLILVSLYGVLASVPIGMLAIIPTQLFYVLTLLAVVAVLAGLPIWGLRVAMKRAGNGAVARFVVTLVSVVVLVPLAAFAWYTFLWPGLHFDPATGRGVRFFAEFTNAYKSVTLRRLPGLEMSELQFYSWWPLRIILFLFVLNMITATVRRIDFNVKNLGVLTVHTGIVIISLGSIYYSGLKMEGDTVLLSANAAPQLSGKTEDGRTVGPIQRVFYDNTDVALYVNEGFGWEQRPMRGGPGGVPRYNDYNLHLIGSMLPEQATPAEPSAWEVAGWVRPWMPQATGKDSRRPLSVTVPQSPIRGSDDPLSLRVVGYCAYGELRDDWVRAAPLPEGNQPLRLIELHSRVPDETGKVNPGRAFSFVLLPATPRFRGAENALMNVEMLLDAPNTSDQQAGDQKASELLASRWRDLAEPLPAGTEHALVVEVPKPDGTLRRVVRPVAPGEQFLVEGWRLTVKELNPEPPFPIITPGYQGATSSVAIVRVEPPAGASEAEPFERWVYHRFPELNQDILDKPKDDGRPNRRGASAAIRVGYIDAAKLHVYLRESASGELRALVRLPASSDQGGQVPGGVREIAAIDAGKGDAGNGKVKIADFVPLLDLVRAASWENARKVERPIPTPELEQERDNVGNHMKALLGLQVAHRNFPGWSEIVWVPFVKYQSLGSETDRGVTLPDGTLVKLSFGRAQHRLPGFQLQLVEFEMLSYDHRGAPRDFQSVVRVTPQPRTSLGFGNAAPEPTVEVPAFDPYVHVASLNAPLNAPFQWTEERPWWENLGGRLAAGLNPRQFKFSQAGWDQQGWNQSQAQVDQGLAEKPSVSFTILGVGNNPGIHVVALGGILMGMGIPWAFYIKPWLVRREKARIQAQVAAGTFVRPARSSDAAPKAAVSEVAQ